MSCISVVNILCGTYLLELSNEPLGLHSLFGSHIGSEYSILGHQAHVVFSLVLLPPVLRPHPLLLGSSEPLSPRQHHERTDARPGAGNNMDTTGMRRCQPTPLRLELLY